MAGEFSKDFPMSKIAFLVTIYLVFSHGFALRGRTNVELELDRQLNSLNKPAVKSIQSEDGDIIDCVDIYKQPGFDHPSLKNHTIKMRPVSYPIGFQEKVSSVEILQLWHRNGRCPEGTIPISRARNHDLLNSDLLKNYGKKYPQNINPLNLSTILAGQSAHEYAIAYLKGDRYYGAQATYNVWNPKVASPSEFSLAQLWLLSGEPSDLNTVEAGWMVYPQIFGDSNTRLFVYWTADGYGATGCYNLKCPGFVQVNNDIALGSTIEPSSVYAGNQFEITILIFKDPKSGEWWLRFQDKMLGYWPASLFTHLADSADTVEWGGEVINTVPDGRHTTTQMGSGHFPDEGFNKSAFIKNMQNVDNFNTLHSSKDLQTIITYPNCYNLQLGDSNQWGSYCYFGGPGQNPSCP